MGDRKRTAAEVIDLLDDDDNDGSDDDDCQIVVPANNNKGSASLATRVVTNRPNTLIKKPIRNPYAPIDNNKKKKAHKIVLERRKRKSDSNQKQSNANNSTKKKAATAASTTSNANDNKPTSSTATASRANSSNGTETIFNVATYNVWFGPPHQDERMRKLAQVLLEKNNPKEAPLWFVGLQEVTPALLATLQPLLEAAGYHVFSQDLMGSYGCALAVLQRGGGAAAATVPKIMEKGWRPFQNTIMNRGFLYVRARLPNSHRQILFTTTHLESFAGEIAPGQKYTGAPQRAQQLPEMEKFCLQKSQQFADISMSIITGDLNWDDERVQSTGDDKELLKVLSSQDWQDSWLNVKKAKLQELQSASKNGKVAKKNIPICYTYDAKESPMLGGSLRRRFDRILVRPSDDTRLNVQNIDLIGKEAIPGLTWRKESVWNGRVTNIKDVPVTPSDHFGYVATLQMHDR